jgi:hypothetical protein
MEELKNILNEINNIDNMIKNRNELYKKRNELENKAIQIIENNDLKNSPLRLGNQRYQYSEMSQKEGITQQYLKEKILEYYNNKIKDLNLAQKETDEIIKYILDKRESYHKTYLKITKV